MLAHHRERTVAMARLLRSLGHGRTRQRLPRQQQPDALRLRYFHALQPLLRQARASFEKRAPAILAELRHERAGQGKQDAKQRTIKEAEQDKKRREQIAAALGVAGPGAKKAVRLVEDAAAEFAAKVHPQELHDVTRHFADETSYWQQLQIDQMVRVAIGVKMPMLAPEVPALLNRWARENVDLIVTQPRRYFDRLKLDVLDAFESGTHADTLAESFVERYGMLENDAQRIARDQVGKLSGQLNEERNKALGVTGYIWRTVRDNRVRDEHYALEGQRFTWDNPPPVGPNGEPCNPGEAIQCRCYAEPDFGELLDRIEATE